MSEIDLNNHLIDKSTGTNSFDFIGILQDRSFRVICSYQNLSKNTRFCYQILLIQFQYIVRVKVTNLVEEKAVPYMDISSVIFIFLLEFEK